MIDYSPIYNEIRTTHLQSWVDTLSAHVDDRIYGSKHGDLKKWFETLLRLPDITCSSCDFTTPTVRIGTPDDVSPEMRTVLEHSLRRFMPWRKGPFELCGIHIDTEWRSDLKWERLKKHILPLKDRLVLDVGCGNGYHLWRMLAEGASLALGIDSTLLYTMQFQALNHYARNQHCSVFPLYAEDLSNAKITFDTVFSMGVLYHARLPSDHLQQLFDCVRDGGELVLETLVIDGGKGDVLMPRERYAKMRNVRFIPSVPTLTEWLEDRQFKNIRCVDVNKTTTEEQHVTSWMEFESLADFLDPEDNTKTIEGYPAPQRAIFVMNK